MNTSDCAHNLPGFLCRRCQAQAQHPDPVIAFRELIEAAEADGWDVDRFNAPILNRARDAYAALAGVPS